MDLFEYLFFGFALYSLYTWLIKPIMSNLRFVDVLKSTRRNKKMPNATKEMEDVYKFKCPIQVGVEVGDKWGHMSP